MQKTPKKGLGGLKENWQSDMVAALSVALIALPLSLGIAIAAGAPPMAGIWSAVVGGIVTTLFRGGHISVNGPAKGVIGVILAGIITLDDGTGQAFNYILAAFVISGAIQALLGILKLGRFADIFHSTVIHGILAAIGIIIFAKQIHVALGTHSESYSIIDNLVDAVKMLPQANPFVVMISVVGLLLMFFHSKISYKLFHLLPTPIWVIALSIPFAYLFNFFDEHTMSFLGRSYNVGPDLLLKVPDSITESIIYPNFGAINTIDFWLIVFSILIITSIESLTIAKAIDKIDPYKRKTDLNKDLTGIGLSTMVAGLIGGLPIIAVIIRSTINVHNGAKTKWSNMYQGIFLLLLIIALGPVMQKVPLCAFAVLLVFTGFKLASPKVFKQVNEYGIEQLIFFLFTLVLTLYTNLLIGLFGGSLLILFVHLLISRMSTRRFIHSILNSSSKLVQKPDGTYSLKLQGIVNFMGILKINKLLDEIPKGANAVIDLSESRLVGHTVLETLHDFKSVHETTEGHIEITGLDNHLSSSRHKLAIRTNLSLEVKHTRRQRMLEEMASGYGWEFQSRSIENPDYFQSFYFFKTRPIEKELNVITHQDEDMCLELIDVTFEESAFHINEEYETTVGLFRLPFQIPKFTIERKDILDLFLPLTEHKDIDYVKYTNFSKKFNIKVDGIEEMDAFMTDKMRELIEACGIHHLESNGEAILMFSNNFQLAQLSEYKLMIDFAETFKKIVRERR
ncbi:MAG: SulP family inorganic anion transporter [Bacteroidia bacterium]|nr:SulP family inorganic anion transporter [Bacteroidia bacterium]